jgi:hypothetical protein
MEQLIRNTQVKGNIGLYYVCYKLALLGWNVMPTARNAKGPDVLAYSEDATETRTIQVKTRAGRDNVMVGRSKDVIEDFWVICCGFRDPECFVLTKNEVRQLCRQSTIESDFWLGPRDYVNDEFRDNWKRIGSPLIPMLPMMQVDYYEIDGDAEVLQ